MKYHQEYAGKNGWCEWIQPKRKYYRIQCCKCGFKHLIQFRLVKNKRGNFIQFRAKELK